jgi:hypothetical protein
MFSEQISKALNKDQLIDWLEEVMQPVEPSKRFLRRLRARMVMYQGGRLPPVWLIAIVGGVILVVVALTLGLALRFLLGLSSLFGLGKLRQRKSKKETKLTST